VQASFCFQDSSQIFIDGAATALELARLGSEVALVERRIDGEVSAKPGVNTRVQVQGNHRVLCHSFLIIAPSLDNYAFLLLEVSHGLEPYPVRAVWRAVTAGEPAQSKSLRSEGEFIDYVRAKFASRNVGELSVPYLRKSNSLQAALNEVRASAPRAGWVALRSVRERWPAWSGPHLTSPERRPLSSFRLYRME
jgi:glycine/D-amino acid oxidase-like deaminating enzyme